MKSLLYSILIAVICYGVTLLMCFISGRIIHGTSHVLAWHPSTVNILFYFPIIMFFTGFMVGVSNIKKG